MDSAILSLEDKVRQILTAPGIDLDTISAKRVRKELLDMDSSLTADFIKQNKDDINKMIATVFEEVNASRPIDEGEEGVGSKRKRDDASNGESEETRTAASAPKKPKKTKSKQEQTDEELARQLQSEINGRGRSSRTATAKPNGPGKKRGAKKSAKRVTEDGEEDNGSGEEQKPKKRGGGFAKEYMLSEPLAALLQVDKLSRPQIVKQLWTHIKANNMQNPENKKEIICDDTFRAIFKCDRIDMFKMNKELGQHLYEPEAAAS